VEWLVPVGYQVLCPQSVLPPDLSLVDDLVDGVAGIRVRNKSRWRGFWPPGKPGGVVRSVRFELGNVEDRVNPHVIR
jgi:hypothetical protein